MLRRQSGTARLLYAIVFGIGAMALVTLARFEPARQAIGSAGVGVVFVLLLSGPGFLVERLFSPVTIARPPRRPAG